MKNFIAKKLMNLGHKLSDNHNDLTWLLPDASDSERAVIQTASPYTSSTPAAQWAFIQSIKHVERKSISGDIVECGVWKGGNLIIAALMRDALGFERGIWGYDTFAGMTEPGDHDVKPGFAVNAREKFRSLRSGAVVDWCYVPIEEVQAAIDKTCDRADIRLVKGDVRETLREPSNVPDTISILRLDTDFYEGVLLRFLLLFMAERDQKFCS